MTTATLPLSTALSASQAARKSLLRRFYDALIEARTRQAMREIALHRHLAPDAILKSAGYQAGPAKNELPFTRSA